MRLNTVAVTTLAGAVLGSVFVWFVGVPLAVAERENFILRQAQVCSEPYNNTATIKLITQDARIHVQCDNNRDLGKLEY